MAKANDVTLFSNGIGHFRRLYDVSGDSQKISIPFKKDHIGDVAASLQVFGEVSLDSPPSFTPSNSDATSLRIDQNNAMISLLTSLSGSKVKVRTRSEEKPYTLLGVEVRQPTENIPQETYVILMDASGVCQKTFKDILNVHFEDESVRAEINKALKQNFQRIKPDSTFLDLALSSLGEKSVEAQIQYTIPVAAWKIRYAIRQHDSKFTLEGAAIIDNNTDEDWDNFRVSVVTGNPISFNTDIASVCVPQRNFVQLVDHNVLGNVDVEEGMAFAAAAMPMGGGMEAAGGHRMLRKASVSNRAEFGMEALDEAAYETTVGPAAQTPGVEAKEVGDFCIFTAKEPLTILARKSAVVPMFEVPLKNAGVVLLYQPKNHGHRPYRTVKFKNNSEYSLGKGKTVIYDNGVFSGECVLQPTKPGENRVLPHCLENGVKINKKPSRTENKKASVSITNGVCITDVVVSSETTYTISNKKDEEFKILVEHDSVLGTDAETTFSGVEIEEKEALSNGVRVYFVLKPNQKVTLTATESKVDSTTVTLAQRTNWLFDYIVHVDNPIKELQENEAIQKCIKIQEKIDAVQIELDDHQNTLQNLEKQAHRVRENMKTTQDPPQEWITDMSETEQKIRKIGEGEVPKLNQELRGLEQQLREALKTINAKWEVA